MGPILEEGGSQFAGGVQPVNMVLWVVREK